MSEEIEIGFCSKCGILREDMNGIPLFDCKCTAEKKHKSECRYLKAVSCYISIPCDEHGWDVCPKCDACDCKTTDSNKKPEKDKISRV